MLLKIVAREQCRKHRLDGDCWMICVHTDQIERARRVLGPPPVVGLAVCPRCQGSIDVGRPDLAELRLSCGVCVAASWPVELPS